MPLSETSSKMAQGVVCPTCHQQPDTPCCASGRDRERSHYSRWRAWQKQAVERERKKQCGHAEIVADPEIEGWEDSTEPAVVILRCTECKQNARAVIEDVALLNWNDDWYGDPK